MANNNTYIATNSPVLEADRNLFTRVWFRFFDMLSAKATILDGKFSTSASAGVASALPSTPAGYMSIIDDQGITRKVPYYNE